MSEFLIRTIEDMEKIYYSRAGMELLRAEDMLAPFVTKADAPVTTGVTGVYNAVFGVQAWVQLNMEANTFGVLPKVPWGRSGWRVITARSASLPTGGIAEAGALPESTKPTFAQVSTKPKTVVQVFEVSEVQEFLATEADDDAYAAMTDLRTYMATEHKENINTMLNTQNGALASNNFESIDRIVASNSELSNCKENDQTTNYAANDLDIYGLDRDAGASWADAYVNHNSSVNRSLTDSIIQTVIQNVLANGGNPTFWQTGYDTWAVINQLYDPSVRYNVLGQATVQPSVNGIKTVEGYGFGVKTATLFGYPVILSKNTVQDAGGISRLYLLDISNPEGFDLPRLCIKIAKPTQYFEAGMSQGTPFAINKLSNKGMYRTMGELICTFFKAQGKARDLKA